MALRSKWLKTLMGAIALGVSVFAFAEPATVHFAVYDAKGQVRVDAQGAATGSVGSGNTWINNPVLATPEHLSGYLVQFWIDPITNVSDVIWSFDWTLASGATVSSVMPVEIYGLSVKTSLTIGTERNGWRKVGGDIIAADMLQNSITPGQIGAGTTVLGAPNSLVWQESVADYVWDSNAATGAPVLSVWAYASGQASMLLSSNAVVRTASYVMLTASAEVVSAPVFATDELIIGSSASDDGSAVPEPGSLALLAGAGLLAGWRRRRDRLKSMPA